MSSSKPWVYLEVRPRKKVKVDREDLKRISQFKWRVTVGAAGRARVVTSYRDDKGKVITMTLGKFLMKPPKGKQVYPRRFLEGLDYRKSNLIVCTLKERQQILPKSRNAAATSQYKGVSFSEHDGKWRAGIEVDGQAINLGLFARESEAAVAYNSAAKKYFGVKAYQNDIKKKYLRKRG